MDSGDLLTVSEVANRSGFAPSAIRFYDKEGLITASRPTALRHFRATAAALPAHGSSCSLNERRCDKAPMQVR